MKIPILNVYYLLCYAWNMLDQSELIDVSHETFRSLPELFARVLETGVTHLLKRGLDRNYITESDETRSPRGKIDVSTTVKRTLLTRSSVHCIFDSLSHDVLHNQIIKSTLSRLARCDELDQSLRDRSLQLYRRLHEVGEISLTLDMFDRVVLHRNNRYYSFLIEVCRILHQSLLVDPKDGSTKFRDFLDDERKMWEVFEKFVGNFYRREQSEFRVNREMIAWQDVEGEAADLAYLPKMRTDVSLESERRKIVIDTKYYPSSLQTFHSSNTIHSAHLYQLFAYLMNLDRKRTPGQAFEGILLYPTVGNDLDLRYKIRGHLVRITTVDLNLPWKEIRLRLLSLIK